METGYFLIADVLGFSKIVTNTSAVDLDGQVSTWLALVDEAYRAAELDREPQLISDTVFASATADAAGLRRLIRFARHLLEWGVPRSLLLRGAITHGPFNWGKLTYGRAVIAAHQLEQSQDWIGFACGELPHVEDLWGANGLVCYTAPMKQGGIKLHPAVVWEVPPPAALQKSSINEPLVMDGEALEWQWRRRLRNTIDFRNYLAGLSSERKEEWRIFQGAPL